MAPNTCPWSWLHSYYLDGIPKVGMVSFSTVAEECELRKVKVPNVKCEQFKRAYNRVDDVRIYHSSTVSEWKTIRDIYARPVPYSGTLVPKTYTICHNRGP